MSADHYEVFADSTAIGLADRHGDVLAAPPSDCYADVLAVPQGADSLWQIPLSAITSAPLDFPSAPLPQHEPAAEDLETIETLHSAATTLRAYSARVLELSRDRDAPARRPDDQILERAA